MGISLVTTAFAFFRDIVNRVLGTLFEFDFIKQLFEDFGVTLDDTKTPFQNLKIIATDVFDKIRGAISEVDKKFGTGQDVNESKIKELEDQMDYEMFDGSRNLGINNHRGVTKSTKKSHKGLR